MATQAPTFVVDTHALVWFLTRDKKLSPRARDVLREAQKGRTRVLVSTIVLAELLYIAERGRAPVQVGEVLKRLKRSPGFSIVDFNLSTFEAMTQLPASLELHDRAIAATALIHGATLLTKDPALHQLGTPPCLW